MIIGGCPFRRGRPHFFARRNGETDQATNPAGRENVNFMSQFQIHERKAGCNGFTSDPQTDMVITEWYDTQSQQIKQADGTIKHVAKQVLVTDPATLDIYTEFGKEVASICTIDTAKDDFHVWNAQSQTHQHIKKRDHAVGIVHRELTKKLGEDNTPTKDFIDKLLNRPAYFGQSGGEGFWPFGPPTFIQNGLVMRNTFRDAGVKPDMSTPLTDAEKHILTDLLNGIIRINLCNLRGHKTFDELFAIIHDTTNDAEFSFRYVVHNIAVNYMMPGYNIPTNLALCGQPGNIGKNLLVGIVQRMLGDTLVGEPHDPTSKFNEWLANKTFIFWNEIEGHSNDSTLNSLIKKCTVDQWVPIQQKNKDQRMIRNMANHWLLSNSLFPYKIDATERRTIFIRTFHDPIDAYEKDRQRFADKVASYNDTDMARALAKFCHYIDLDMDVLRYRETELTRLVHTSSGSPFEQFMTTESLKGLVTPDKKPSGRIYYAVRLSDLVSDYAVWAKTYGYPALTASKMKAEMAAHSKWFRAANGRFYLEAGLLKARGGMPFLMDASEWTPPSTDDDIEASEASATIEPVQESTATTSMSAGNDEIPFSVPDPVAERRKLMAVKQTPWLTSTPRETAAETLQRVKDQHQVGRGAS